MPRDNMFILENYLATVLPCQAVRCALDGIDRLKQDGQIREELKTKFEELASDKVWLLHNHNLLCNYVGWCPEITILILDL